MPSEKILEQKKQLVSDLSEKLKNSVAGVLVSYKGISVADDTKLRSDLRAAGVEYGVVKNTMLHLAAEKADLSELDSVLTGTTALAISAEDHVAAAKVLKKFAETHKTFEIKAGFVEGKVIDKAGRRGTRGIALQGAAHCPGPRRLERPDYRSGVRPQREHYRSCTCPQRHRGEEGRVRVSYKLKFAMI